MAEFRIFHPKSKKYRQFEAEDAEQAIARSGWKATDCEVRVKTPKGGWAKVFILDIIDKPTKT